jgi:hypothetical protein
MRGPFVLLLLVLVASPALADTPVREHSVAVNPVFAPLGTVTAEYEGVVAPALTLGLSGWYEYRDVEARWLYAKTLYYPGGTALRGLGLGFTAGVIWAYADDDAVDTMAEDSAPLVGLMAQYDLVLFDRLLLGVGIGGRVVAAEIADDSPLRRFDGDVRLVAGLVF